MFEIFSFLKLMISLIQFKIIRSEEDFWTWLFAKISNRKIQNKPDRCFIVFLLSDAYEYQNYDGVCNVCELVESCMGENRPTEKGFYLVLDSAIKANRLDLKNRLKKN